MPADVVHEGGINPRHERGDGFPGVVGRPTASPTNLELQASGCRGVRTLGQDLLDGIVVLLSIVVVRKKKKLRVAIPSEGVRVAFCSELQTATFYKFPKFAFTFIISCMNC